MKILILEDYFPLQQQLIELVEQQGHEAVAVQDAEEATKRLMETAFNAVILDVYLKQGGRLALQSGVTVLSRIRHASSYSLAVDPRVPILAISGGHEVEGGYSPLRLARDLGADFWLRKPLDLQELILWINDVEIGLRGV